MAAVGIIGSGNVGANTAFFIAEKGIEDVLLYDIQEGLATGKTLDMMETAPIRRYRNRIGGTDSLEALAGCEVIVVAAGQVRKPGMKREELFSVNRKIITGLAPQLAEAAPESKVIIATEPVDMITTLFLRETGFPRGRVMGLGGLLDATRLRYMIAGQLGVSMENVTATVIGRHSDDMIGLPAYCSVSGIPLTQLMSLDKIEELLEQTRKAGDLIVSMAQRSSAFYAPSAAAAELVDSIHMDLHRILSVSVMLEGEYDLKGVAMSLPSIIGKEGVLRVLTPRLTAEEQKQISRSAESLERLIEGRAS